MGSWREKVRELEKPPFKYFVREPTKPSIASCVSLQDARAALQQIRQAAPRAKIFDQGGRSITLDMIHK